MEDNKIVNSAESPERRKSGKLPKREDIKMLEQQRQDASLEARKFLAIINNTDDEIQKAVAFTHSVAVIGDRADVNDPDSLWACFMQYAELCYMTGMLPEELGAYMSMGITKKTATEWLTGRARAEDPRYKAIIEKVSGICGTARSALASQGKLPPSLAIWRDKNFEGMSDNPPGMDYEDSQDEGLTPQQIADKYKDILA